jgi:methionine biosynthesis protein MetW
MVVAAMIPDGSRVLDLGCGSGDLLAELIERRGCRGQGVEVSPEAFHACVARGIPVVEADIDEGLPDFDDDSFDVVVLSQTLQATHRPTRVLREMMRVGRVGIVSFPNFGHWRLRLDLGVRGRMPRSRTLPYRWHDTPNIHLCTIRDFRALCREEGLCIEREIALRALDRPPARLRRPNLTARIAIFSVRRCESVPPPPPEPLD